MAANRPFLRLIAAFLLNGFANAIPATLFLYFVSDRLGAPDWRGPLLLVYFACAVAGVPLAVRAANRFGKHRAWCGAMLATCPIFALAGFLGPGDVSAFVGVAEPLFGASLPSVESVELQPIGAALPLD